METNVLEAKGLTMELILMLLGSHFTYKGTFNKTHMNSVEHATLRFCYIDGENGGTMWYPWDWGPLIINPICILYNGYLLGISPFEGLLAGVKQLGHHPKRLPPFSP